MEVNCVESSALNKGSSEVTCTSGTEFKFEYNEPECIKTGIVETDVFNDHATKRYLNSSYDQGISIIRTDKGG